MKRGTDDSGDPRSRVGRGQVAETLYLALLALGVGENRLACSGPYNHFQFLQRGAFERVDPKLNLFARDRLRFMRLGVGYQILASAHSLADTSNIVVHHVLEEHPQSSFPIDGFVSSAMVARPGIQLRWAQSEKAVVWEISG